MRISYQWLKEYVDFTLSPAQLAEELTMLGLEIESIEDEGDDCVLELSITPNRGDCLSHIGLAREIAMLEGTGLRLPVPESSAIQTNPSKSGSWEVNITVPGLCPRYAACIIQGVRVAASPEWLSKRLQLAGIRPINNVVDITNYVLLEWGQPLHAFDLDSLSPNKIVVRRAQKGEKFRTLDGGEYHLDEQMLVISDAEKAIALGGVMGGANSQVGHGTCNILLECAYFNPVTIRHTSRKLGLSTESSFRFERGTDGHNLLQPLLRAVQLIRELAAGTPIEPIIDNYPLVLEQREIFLRFARVNRILGTQLTPAGIKSLSERLFFQISAENSEGIRLRVPSFRQEIEREIDLIEEIARLYGYNRIPSTVPRGELPAQTYVPEQLLREKIRCFLTSCGLWEAINFSFTSQSSYSRIERGGQGLRLSNPLTQEGSILRSTLVPGLLENILHNLNRQVSDLKLFEIGHCFRQAPDGTKQERSFLALALTGNAAKVGWHTPPRKLDFYDLKGIAEGLLKYLGFDAWQWEKAKDEDYLHPGQSAELKLGGARVGKGGRLHPRLEQEFGLPQAVFVWEFDLQKLASKLPAANKVVSLPRYPATFRDLAVVVDEALPAARVQELIKDSAGDFLKDVQLFDLYTGNQVGKGKKSLAFALTYQSEEGTLSEEQVNLFQDRIIRALENKLGASLR